MSFAGVNENSRPGAAVLLLRRHVGSKAELTSFTACASPALHVEIHDKASAVVPRLPTSPLPHPGLLLVP